MKVFSDRPHKGGKPNELKEWVIERIKKGCIPSQIVEDAKRLHGASITLMSIWRWRKKYIKKTGEHLPSYQEFLRLKKGIK
jgi:IS30 family transposase